MFNPVYAEYLSQQKMNENMEFVRQAQLLRAMRESKTQTRNARRPLSGLLHSLWPFNQPRALGAAR
jgi:hypothetical protein